MVREGLTLVTCCSGQPIMCSHILDMTASCSRIFPVALKEDRSDENRVTGSSFLTDKIRLLFSFFPNERHFIVFVLL